MKTIPYHIGGFYKTQKKRCNQVWVTCSQLIHNNSDIYIVTVTWYAQTQQWLKGLTKRQYFQRADHTDHDIPRPAHSHLVALVLPALTAPAFKEVLVLEAATGGFCGAGLTLAVREDVSRSSQSSLKSSRTVTAWVDNSNVLVTPDVVVVVEACGGIGSRLSDRHIEVVKVCRKD